MPSRQLRGGLPAHGTRRSNDVGFLRIRHPQVRRADRRQPLTWASVPEDYDVQIRVLRRERGVSQAQFAAMIGAAGKAVVYQWEARKRCPSPVFWCRIMDLDPTLPDVAKTAGLSPPPPDH